MKHALPNRVGLSTRSVAGALYLLLLILISLYAYHFPAYDWDTLGYTGNVYLLSGLAPCDAHKQVYEEIRTDAPPLAYTGLTTGIGLSRAQDCASFIQYMPFYAIRPGFIGPAYLLYRLGLPPVKAVMLLSIIGYLAVGLLLYIWLTIYIRPFKAMWLCSAMAVALAGFSRLGSPMLLSTAAMLLTFYLWLEKGKPWPGVLILLLSLTVRTENLIVLIVLLVALWARHELTLTGAGYVAFVSIGIVGFINHLARNYGWHTLFMQSFYGPYAYPQQLASHVTPRLYLHTLAINTVSLAYGLGAFAVLIAAGMLCFKTSAYAAYIVTAVSAVLKHLLYPSSEIRHFLVLFILGFIVLSLKLASQKTQQISGQVLPQSKTKPGNLTEFSPPGKHANLFQEELI